VLLAQVELPTTQPATAPATQPATQPSTQATTQPAIGPIATSIPVRAFDPHAHVMFNFSNATIDSILDYMSESLGFIIIKDTRIDTRVTVSSRQAVNAAESVDLLNSVLKPAGYTAVQSGRTLRVMARDKAKKANIPVYFGSDPEQIRASDELITQVMPLGQVDAVKLRQDLTNLFSPDADIASNAGSNTIIITDSSANIRRIAEIIASLNQHTASSTDIKIFQLQYASATNAAKLINDVFKVDDTGTAGGAGAGQGFRFGRFGGGGGGFPGMPGGGGAAAGGGTPSDEGMRKSGKVLASADDRTNTLVVSGPKDLLPTIERVVKEIDSNPAETNTVFTYPLRNGQAQHMQDVLNTLFGTANASGSRTSTSTNTLNRNPFGGTTSGGMGSSSSGFGGGSNRSSSSSMGGSSSFGSSFGGSSSSSTSPRSGSGTVSFGGAGSTPQLSAAARAASGDLTGQVYVVADPDTNSLLITTAPKFVDKVKMIIAELDRSVPQVLIKVLLAEVSHENTSDIGVQMSFINKRDSGFGSSVGTDFGLTKATGGLVVSIAEENFQATLRALATEGKVDVLSRPYILASDNQLASILVGQYVPFITDTRIDTNSNVINTVSYQNVGIILNVVPHINPDGKVIMDVAPEISALIPGNGVQISAGVTAPVFSTRSAQSRIAVENGRTVVIGGLMEDKKNTTITKVPLLGDIPVLGNLFKRTQDDKTKTELLIFLTPHVAMEASALKAMSKDEMGGAKILPDAVAPHAFEEQLKGMQRGATTAPSEPLYVAPPQPDKK
jgi:general secretion pathway protein D